MILPKKVQILSLFSFLFLLNLHDVTSFAVNNAHVHVTNIPTETAVHAPTTRPCEYTYTTTKLKLSSSSSSSSLQEPNEQESNFGRRDYWNDFYAEEADFRWYSDWNDIQPFFEELVPLVPVTMEHDQGHEQQHEPKSKLQPPRVLLPGIGNDASMVDMYDYGYKYLTAFDYAEEGVECAKKFFGERLLSSQLQEGNGEGDGNDQKEEEIVEERKEGVDLRVADARELPYDDQSFDAVLEKGTLDAIFLSGGSDKELAARHLDMSVRELARVVRTGGIVMSITAACADDVRASFDRCNNTSDDDANANANSCVWKILRDGEFYTTEEGYTSNNVDATIFAWERI